MPQRTITFDGAAVPVADGDTVLSALLRAGIHPGGGGCICAAGDCPACLALVDGVAYTRTCLTPARPGTAVERQDLHDPPPPRSDRHRAPQRVRTVHADVVVIGGGRSGTTEAARLRSDGLHVVVIDAVDGEQAVGVYPGPHVVARTEWGLRRLWCDEVVVATGSRETQPACPGNDLIGILTPRAAEGLAARGVPMGVTVAVGEVMPAVADVRHLPGRLLRIEPREDAPRQVGGVVVRDDAGRERRTACDTVVVGLGTQPRDVLARMGAGIGARPVGGAAREGVAQPPPTAGEVCRCSQVTVEALESVRARGFAEMELVKRATLAGTGTCQGAACLPHLQAWLRAGPDERPHVATPFTARPLARQATMGEVSAGYHPPPVRRTPLHDVHLALGARMERSGGWWRPWTYDDPEAEYRAVRHAVSLGDVSTLGKIEVSGPDVAAFLDRIYPAPVSTLRPGRSRYALVLDEGGYVIDDGMVSRRSPTRYCLSFTSAGGGHMEMWLRDWAASWQMDVRIMDLTMARAAINVTGPMATTLLQRVGLDEPLGFMDFGLRRIADIDCEVFRLSFTGEISYELHHRADRAVPLWEALMAAGEDLGCTPHGLDTLLLLRLEKGHIIVGQDTDLDATPDRIRHAWAARLDDERDFLGKANLRRIAGRPPSSYLLGFTIDTEQPSFEGDTVWAGDSPVGYTTSMRHSPVLGLTVGLAQIEVDPAGRPPDGLTVAGEPITLTDPPFYDPGGERARA